MALPPEFSYGLLGATILFGFALLNSYMGMRNARARAIRASLHHDEAEFQQDQADTDEIQRRLWALEEENARLEEELERLRESMGRSTHRGPDQPTSVENLYKRILGLDPAKSPSAQELKASYRAAVKRYHPDQGGDEGALRLVVEAHDYLRSRAQG